MNVADIEAQSDIPFSRRHQGLDVGDPVVVAIDQGQKDARVPVVDLSGHRGSCG